MEIRIAHSPDSDDPFLFYALALQSRASLKKDLFDNYLARGGADPRVLRYLFNADKDVFQRAVAFSFNHEAAGDVLLLEAAARALRADKARREMVMAAYGTGDGVKTVDADGDGFYEEKYILAGGEGRDY